MRRLTPHCRRWLHDESGAALVEYTVLLAMIVIAVIAIMFEIGEWIVHEWNLLEDALHSAMH